MTHRREVHGDRGSSTRRSPRFLQTPLRRSPRLHPQTNDLFLGDGRSQSKNKPPKDLSRKQSRSKPSPISADSAKRSSLKKGRSVGSGLRQEVERRRSPRLALRSDAGLKAGKAVDVGDVVDLKERQENAAPIEGGEKKRKRIRIGEEKREEIQVDRGEVEERGGGGGVEGWTKDQELELRRAYLLARPSPHFWKKVAKMVPGKSAQECFDRVHADLATPPQSHPVSRLTKLVATPIADFNLSSSIAALGCNAKRPRRGKQKILFAQKTVRHLLRKHQVIDQSKEADLFSVLETSPTALTMDFPEVETPASPQCMPTPIGFLKRCSERSLSARKGTCSRFRPPDQANYTSPEVLKPIKNMVLHEKYINQLHCREAKRRTLAKTTSSVAARDGRHVTSLKTDIKAVKTTLLSEAKDAIAHFQHLQADPFGDHIDDDDDDDDFDGFNGFNSANDDE